MATAELVTALTDADAYSHPCEEIRVVETHISWVFLTGAHAYKVKKPVDLGFVDFSTLARREHFCREELRCNRAFSPGLYLDVVPIVAAPEGIRVGGDGEPIDWAVKMVQFDDSKRLDRLLAAGDLDADALHEFGVRLAGLHEALPRWDRPFPLERVIGPMIDNFAVLRRLDAVPPKRLDPIERVTGSEFARLEPLIRRRAEAGFVRECHGDLHLANLVRTDRGIKPFDCLEFDEKLRWNDVMSDAAFLFMDVAVLGRTDLAYAFVDGVLEGSGDAEGAALLPLFALYRAMVRAKVAGIRLSETGAATEAADLEAHLAWAEARTRRAVGRLVITCGVSGSGKSHLASRLVRSLPAIRIRSDVLRKRLAGLAAGDRSGSGVGEGLYTAERTAALYREMAEQAAGLLSVGETVVVDATFLDAVERRRLEAVATQAGAAFSIVWCDAPEPLLRERVATRSAERVDASEADLRVLESQLRRFDPPTSAAVVRVDTSGVVDVSALAERLRG